MALETLLGYQIASSIQREINGKIWLQSQVDTDKQEAGFKKPFVDPYLRDQTTYAKLIRRLLQSGVIDLVVDHGQIVESVGVLAVAKKSGSSG